MLLSGWYGDDVPDTRSRVSIVGAIGKRLSWPYGDLVPGNYLAKACLPAFVILVA